MAVWVCAWVACGKHYEIYAMAELQDECVHPFVPQVVVVHAYQCNVVEDSGSTCTMERVPNPGSSNGNVSNDDVWGRPDKSNVPTPD